jgi:hypothetical protein
VAHLKIGKPGKGRYTISFDTEAGKITCEVLALPAPLKGSSAAEEREAALKRAKRLAKAFCEALPDS